MTIKRRVDGNKKGGRAERSISNLLEEWCGFEFARVPQSGGLGWKNRVQVTGDVIPTDPREMADFPFSVEVKFHKEIKLQDPLLGQSAKWYHDWWQQSVGDANRSKKLPILFMRRNGMGKDTYFVVVTVRTWQCLIDAGISPGTGYYSYITSDETVIIFLSKYLWEVDFEEFEYQLEEEYGTDYSNH